MSPQYITDAEAALATLLKKIGLGFMAHRLYKSENNVHNQDKTPELTLAIAVFELTKKAEQLNTLRDLIGYVEQGEGTTVCIWQDDATKDFMLNVGPRQYWGHSLLEVLAAAKAGEAE